MAAPPRCVRRLARKKRRNPRVKVRMFLANKYVETLVNLLIVWALFMEDIRILLIPKQADETIWGVHAFVMGVFVRGRAARASCRRRAAAARASCRVAAAAAPPVRRPPAVLVRRPWSSC